MSRFGTLLYQLNFNPHYLGRLKKNVGNLEISNGALEKDHSTPSIINLGIGVEDDTGIYRGFVNIRINPAALVERVHSLAEQYNIQALLLNKSNKILASSVNLSSNEKKEFSQRMKILNVENFSLPGYIFTKIYSINEYPFWDT